MMFSRYLLFAGLLVLIVGTFATQESKSCEAVQEQLDHLQKKYEHSLKREFRHRDCKTKVCKQLFNSLYVTSIQPFTKCENDPCTTAPKADAFSHSKTVIGGTPKMDNLIEFGEQKFLQSIKHLKEYMNCSI